MTYLQLYRQLKSAQRGWNRLYWCIDQRREVVKADPLEYWLLARRYYRFSWRGRKLPRTGTMPFAPRPVYFLLTMAVKVAVLRHRGR